MTEAEAEARYAEFTEAALRVRQAAGTRNVASLLAIYGMTLTALFNAIPIERRAEALSQWIRLLAGTIQWEDGDDGPPVVH